MHPIGRDERWTGDGGFRLGGVHVVAAEQVHLYMVEASYLLSHVFRLLILCSTA